MHGSHVIKSWSNTQATIALSSGEAAYDALVKGASNAMGIQELMKDLGNDQSTSCLPDLRPLWLGSDAAADVTKEALALSLSCKATVRTAHDARKRQKPPEAAPERKP